MHQNNWGNAPSIQTYQPRMSVNSEIKKEKKFDSTGAELPQLVDLSTGGENNYNANIFLPNANFLPVKKEDSCENPNNHGTQFDETKSPNSNINNLPQSPFYYSQTNNYNNSNTLPPNNFNNYPYYPNYPSHYPPYSPYPYGYGRNPTEMMNPYMNYPPPMMNPYMMNYQQPPYNPMVPQPNQPHYSVPSSPVPATSPSLHYPTPVVSSVPTNPSQSTTMGSPCPTPIATSPFPAAYGTPIVPTSAYPQMNSYILAPPQTPIMAPGGINGFMPHPKQNQSSFWKVYINSQFLQTQNPQDLFEVSFKIQSARKKEVYEDETAIQMLFSSHQYDLVQRISKMLVPATVAANATLPVNIACELRVVRETKPDDEILDSAGQKIISTKSNEFLSGKGSGIFEGVYRFQFVGNSHNLNNTKFCLQLVFSFSNDLQHPIMKCISGAFIVKARKK